MNNCTMCSQCELFKGTISLPEDVMIMYKYHYCLSENNRWKECKRYLFSSFGTFCPAFVMPNSLLSMDQIWQKVQREYVVPC